MMKSLLAVVAMLPMATFAASSVPVGTLELGGSTNLGFSSSSEKIEDLDGLIDQTVWSLGGTALYFVSPNLSVGGRLNYTSLSVDAGGGESGAPFKTLLMTMTLEDHDVVIAALKSVQRAHDLLSRDAALVHLARAHMETASE